MGTAAESRLALARVELEVDILDPVQKFASQAKDEFDRKRQVDLVALSDAVRWQVVFVAQRNYEAMGFAEIAEKSSNTSEDHDNQTQTALEVGRAFMQMDRRTSGSRLRFALSESEHYHCTRRLFRGTDRPCTLRPPVWRSRSMDRSKERECGG